MFWDLGDSEELVGHRGGHVSHGVLTRGYVCFCSVDHIKGERDKAEASIEVAAEGSIRHDAELDFLNDKVVELEAKHIQARAPRPCCPAPPNRALSHAYAQTWPVLPEMTESEVLMCLERLCLPRPLTHLEGPRRL